MLNAQVLLQPLRFELQGREVSLRFPVDGELILDEAQYVFCNMLPDELRSIDLIALVKESHKELRSIPPNHPRREVLVKMAELAQLLCKVAEHHLMADDLHVRLIAIPRCEEARTKLKSALEDLGKAAGYVVALDADRRSTWLNIFGTKIVAVMDTTPHKRIGPHGEALFYLAPLEQFSADALARLKLHLSPLFGLPPEEVESDWHAKKGLPILAEGVRAARDWNELAALVPHEGGDHAS